jgi:hypothetical protein
MTTSPSLRVAVFRPMAMVKTSMAMETDARVRDIECLRGIRKTPRQLYILSQQCQACFQTVHTCPRHHSPDFRLTRGARDLCDHGQDRGLALLCQRYSSTRTYQEYPSAQSQRTRSGREMWIDGIQQWLRVGADFVQMCSEFAARQSETPRLIRSTERAPSLDPSALNP